MKKQILSAALAAVISMGIFSAPVQQYIGTSSVAAAAAAVSAPSASKKSGTYSSSGAFSVKLTAGKGADIYYSTGGSYKLYTKALKITKNTTVKCYAQKDGVKSKTVTLKYKLSPKVTVTNKGGSYDSAVKVKLSSTASGVKFYYTLDGSKPTTSSALYTTKGITVSRTSSLRVLAAKSGWSKKYLREEYVINGSGSALSSENLLDNYKDKYAYNTLTRKQKDLYAKIFDAAAAYKEKVYMSYEDEISGNDVEMAYWAFDRDNPQFFWLANGYRFVMLGNNVTTIYMEYSRTREQAEQIQPTFDAEAQKIIDKALAQDNLFDRVLVIHDALTERTIYDANAPSYKSEADGPLVYGKALCEGYSKAFMYLCQAVGIPCICIEGYAGEDHMWNMLKLDGEWYHMDVTWDDAGTYEYFCIPEKKMTVDHTISNPFPIPEATATKYSYSEVMGITEYSDVNSAYNGLVEQAAANFKSGVYETTIFVEAGVMNGLKKKISDQQFFKDLAAKGCNTTGWSSSSTQKSITLTLKR